MKKAKELVLDKKNGFDRISFTYENVYGTIYIYCSIHRIYYQHLPVKASGKTEKEALANALALLKKLKEIEVANKLYKKEVTGKCVMDLQDNKKISFKEERDTHFVRNIWTVDKYEFTTYFKPNPLIPKYFKKLEGNNFMGMVVDYPLADGEEMYYWDTIAPLSGSAGLAVSKGKYVIKTKILIVS